MGEVTPLDRLPEDAFRDQQPLLRHSFLQSIVMTGIHAIETGPEHGHRSSIRLKAALMHCGINAFGKAADHRPT
jgi:hypothetical protein